MNEQTKVTQKELDEYWERKRKAILDLWIERINRNPEYKKHIKEMNGMKLNNI